MVPKKCVGKELPREMLHRKAVSPACSMLEVTQAVHRPPSRHPEGRLVEGGQHCHSGPELDHGSRVRRNCKREVAPRSPVDTHKRGE